MKKDQESLFGGVMLAYLVIGLHFLLIAALGVMILLFRSLVQYWMWIWLIGLLVILVCGYLLFRRMRAQGKTLKQVLHSPILQGRPVEVRLLGGLVVFRSGAFDSSLKIEGESLHKIGLLEDANAMGTRDIMELARLFEKKLITREEFEKTKQQILQ